MNNRDRTFLWGLMYSAAWGMRRRGQRRIGSKVRAAEQMIHAAARRRMTDGGAEVVGAEDKTVPAVLVHAGR